MRLLQLVTRTATARAHRVVVVADAHPILPAEAAVLHGDNKTSPQGEKNGRATREGRPSNFISESAAAAAVGSGQWAVTAWGLSPMWPFPGDLRAEGMLQYSGISRVPTARQRPIIRDMGLKPMLWLQHRLQRSFHLVVRFEVSNPCR